MQTKQSEALHTQTCNIFPIKHCVCVCVFQQFSRAASIYKAISCKQPINGGQVRTVIQENVLARFLCLFFPPFGWIDNRPRPKMVNDGQWRSIAVVLFCSFHWRTIELGTDLPTRTLDDQTWKQQQTKWAIIIIIILVVVAVVVVVVVSDTSQVKKSTQINRKWRNETRNYAKTLAGIGKCKLCILCLHKARVSHSFLAMEMVKFGWSSQASNWSYKVQQRMENGEWWMSHTFGGLTLSIDMCTSSSRQLGVTLSYSAPLLKSQFNSIRSHAECAIDNSIHEIKVKTTIVRTPTLC